MKTYIFYVSTMLFSMFFWLNATTNEDVKNNGWKYAALVAGWPITLPVIIGMWAGDEFKRSEFAKELKTK